MLSYACISIHSHPFPLSSEGIALSMTLLMINKRYEVLCNTYMLWCLNHEYYFWITISMCLLPSLSHLCSCISLYPLPRFITSCRDDCNRSIWWEGIRTVNNVHNLIVCGYILLILSCSSFRSSILFSQFNRACDSLC